MSVNVVQTLNLSAKIFWVYCLHVCMKREEKPTISTSANTVYLLHLCPLLSLPTSVQNRYFQRQTGAKTERRRHGRCSDLSAQHAHPTKVGVTLNTFITTVLTQLVKNAVLFIAHFSTHTHKHLQCYYL